MNLVIAQTEINPSVDKYINSIRDKAKAESNAISNPMETKVYSFKKNSKQYNILSIKLTLLPAYYLLFLSIVLYIIFPNMFTIILMGIFTIISIPFTNLFWRFMFRYGLRKKGYKGKIIFLMGNTAWGDYLWGK